MEEPKKTDTKKKLKSAAIKAAGTVTAAGMLLNAAVEPEDLLTSRPQKAVTPDAAHIQYGSVPVYTVQGATPEKAPAPTKAELFREKVISLPAPVKGLILLPLWTLGAIANYALSLLLSLFAAVFGGSVLTFLFQFALIFGLFALVLKLLFPHKKLKDLLTKRNLLWMAISALVLTAADMLLKTWYEPYAKIRALILLVLALILLSLLAWRIVYKRKKPEPEPQTATYEII
ncbi:MAG: hypothetical protein IJQ45_08040 [Clostridia bacterium]|nr:hypothetical protein [Clostridia bacterium]MBR0206671.1 hypothetical protein [Clostridia bacterium]